MMKPVYCSKHVFWNISIFSHPRLHHRRWGWGGLPRQQYLRFLMMMSAMMMTLEIWRKQRHRPHAAVHLFATATKLSSCPRCSFSSAAYQSIKWFVHCALMALDLNVIPAVAAMAAEVKSCSCTFSQVKSLSAQPSGCLWLDAACERSVNSLAQIIKQLLYAVCWWANYKTAGAQIAELSHSHSRLLQLLLNCSSSCRLGDRKGLCCTLLLGQGKVISRLLKSWLSPSLLAEW